MAGHLAVSFSDLMDDLWTTRGKVLAPRNFKDTIGRFNAMFEGQQQQDAQVGGVCWCLICRLSQRATDAQELN